MAKEKTDGELATVLSELCTVTDMGFLTIKVRKGIGLHRTLTQWFESVKLSAEKGTPVVRISVGRVHGVFVDRAYDGVHNDSAYTFFDFSHDYIEAVEEKGVHYATKNIIIMEVRELGVVEPSILKKLLGKKPFTRESASVSHVLKNVNDPHVQIYKRLKETQ